MTTDGWHLRPMAAFDTETTGVDPTQVRIVTAALLSLGGEIARARHWLVNPGIPIPAEATAVHGITDERAAQGMDPAVAVEEIAREVCGAWDHGLPVVIMNAAYDLTLLDHELARHHLPTLGERGAYPGLVIDPLVLDRHIDRYRKGSRRLDALCEHYQVRLDDAHAADGDAVAAARVAWRIGCLRPDIAAMDADELTALQRIAHADWAEGFQAHLRRRGDADAVIDGTWPYRPAEAQAVLA